jgi:hypothetical protein
MNSSLWADEHFAAGRMGSRVEKSPSMKTIELVYGPADGGKIEPNTFTAPGAVFVVPEVRPPNVLRATHQYKMVTNERAEYVFPTVL